MISRRLIAVTPVLLVLGIVAQLLLLIAAVVLYVPCLIWPGILNRPYTFITRGMARIFAKSVIGRRREKSSVELPFRDLANFMARVTAKRTRRAVCLPLGASLCYHWAKSPT